VDKNYPMVFNAGYNKVLDPELELSKHKAISIYPNVILDGANY